MTAFDPDVAGPEPLPLPEYPYRPLVPFESEDRALFTGREDDTVRCAAAFWTRPTTQGLVLHGAGGVRRDRRSFNAQRSGAASGHPSRGLSGPARSYAGRTNRKRKRLPGNRPTPGFDLLGQLAEALCASVRQPYSYTTRRDRRSRSILQGFCNPRSRCVQHRHFHDRFHQPSETC